MSIPTGTFTVDSGIVFNGRPSSHTTVAWDPEYLKRQGLLPYVPRQNDEFLPMPWVTDVILWLTQDAASADPLYIYGPTGSGKTTAVKCYASKLNYPVFETTAHGRLEFSDLVGTWVLQGDTHAASAPSMQFKYGPLSLALKYGGVFLLNEIDLLSPEVAAGLNSVLDGSGLLIPENGGEYIPPHPMFRFVATANTNGSGSNDSTGLSYLGTLRQNTALMDRFWLVESSYLDQAREIDIISAELGEDDDALAPMKDKPRDLAGRMVAYATVVRGLSLDSSSASVSKTVSFLDKKGESKLLSAEALADKFSGLDVTFSTRALIRWARLIRAYAPLSAAGLSPVTHSLDRALLFRASPSSRSALKELYQRVFG